MWVYYMAKGNKILVGELRFFTDEYKARGKYLVLPNENNPRIIVPLKNYNLSVSGLRVHNTASSKNRFIKTLLPLGYLFLKNTNLGTVYNGTNELEDLIHVAKRAINTYDICDLSVYVGTRKSRNRKLTFLLLDEDGNGLGILKYPIEKQAALFIENEYSALKSLINRQFSSLIFPSKPKIFDFEGDKVLYEENIFNNTRQLINELNKLIVDASVELALKTGYKKIHSYFDETLNELDNIKEVNSFRERYESISDELSNLGFPPVAVHGDFVLYNMQSDSKRLHLIDLEYFREGLPLFDLFHFVFQGKYQIERMNVERSYRGNF